MRQIMELFDDGYGTQIVPKDDCCIEPLHDSSNWSTIDIDAPYHLYSVCDLAIVQDTKICCTCTCIQSFLDDNDDNIDS